jgi:hypothetical protein
MVMNSRADGEVALVGPSVSARDRLNLQASQLRWRCDPERLRLPTAEQPSEYELIGQERAAAALTFGLAMDERSFNVYVAGPPGTGKTAACCATTWWRL